MGFDYNNIPNIIPPGATRNTIGRENDGER